MRVLAKELYKDKLIKIPRPEFYVLYNGKAVYPDKAVLRLSDAFISDGEETAEKGVSLELIVNVININKGRNKDILQKCQPLDEYAALVSKIQEYSDCGMTNREAIREAVKYCIAHGVLKEFLEQHREEVEDMLAYEYDRDTHLEAKLEEGMEIGMEKGMEKGRGNVALNLFARGLDFEFIMKVTGLPKERLMELERETLANV
jgi:hypothetical protein